MQLGMAGLQYRWFGGHWQGTMRAGALVFVELVVAAIVVMVEESVVVVMVEESVEGCVTVGESVEGCGAHGQFCGERQPILVLQVSGRFGRRMGFY